ncbi:class I SAM-dependent methyltransferase [Polynucleobacter sp. UB-Piko-W3]|uniref:class I SAM-dependent methyltransferase n=1 Tax=Polynucleobacter sp. UB-Piko-W3 TaxID=1819735 RepID=UPI001C0BA577|nr:class I SAM-dependent methyltransferase [Polynucleobacter sp. UB-Piko-W3]MBU3553984.1 class I SAM-dependent methyltransferase [Polynucleobacter sp. UB-Piko-W3]
MRLAFEAKLLRKFNAKFEVCEGCGFLRTPNPTWLVEAYDNAIADADTGLVMRNFLISRKVACILYFLLNFRSKAVFLDFAGGYGLLVRLMRDIGFNFFWRDRYCKNILSSGFEYEKSTHGPCNAVTAMEVMEHIEDPMTFIADIFKETNCTALIFSTQLYDGPPPDPNTWWYYVFNTGQHISFYQKKTFDKIASNLGLHFYTANGIHLLSKERVNIRFLPFITHDIFCRIFTIYIASRLGSKTINDHLQILNKSSP